MIRPAVFGANQETAATNEFQKKITTDDDRLLALALREFDGVVAQLQAAGVQVVEIADSESPVTPDAIFPNNWLTTHRDGQCVLYPMQPRSRRPERRPDIIRQLASRYDFDVRRIVDWSDFENHDLFLEGTGSVVLDRVHRNAYACLSTRTDHRVLEYFCEHFNYQAVEFAATGPSGQAIYHTNVMMCVGTHFAIICAEAIADPGQRDQVLDELATHHEIVTLSMVQMSQFGGNMLELRNHEDQTLLVMSRRACAALEAGQRRVLERHAQIIACDVDTIEDTSGGSVRCMLAEIYLSRR
ncbi:MAG: amidinotransferase [Gammaproteobacteria bacterium]|nr:amidinotransferase [Gammaproteobacteria bacterium]